MTYAQLIAQAAELAAQAARGGELHPDAPAEDEAAQAEYDAESARLGAEADALLAQARQVRFLCLYSDGTNGVRRGRTFRGLPPGFVERNPGEGIYESQSGASWLVELRDDPTCEAAAYGEED